MLDAVTWHVSMWPHAPWRRPELWSPARLRARCWSRSPPVSVTAHLGLATKTEHRHRAAAAPPRARGVALRAARSVDTARDARTCRHQPTLRQSLPASRTLDTRKRYSSWKHCFNSFYELLNPHYLCNLSPVIMQCFQLIVKSSCYQ